MDPHSVNFYNTDPDQGMDLDLSSFDAHFPDYSQLAAAGATTTDPNRTLLSHDDSCLDQPGCLGPFPSQNAFDYIPNQHQLQRQPQHQHQNQPPHQTQQMAFPQPLLHLPDDTAHPQTSRGISRSASMSMATNPYTAGPGPMASGLGLAHPAQACHQTECESGSCPVRKDELAANTLMSFAGGSQQTAEEVAHTCCHAISPNATLFQFPVELPVWNHILSCHNKAQPEHCDSTCPAANPLVYRECHIPIQYNSAAPTIGPMQMNANDSLICGSKFTESSDYIDHFNQMHRAALPIVHEHHHNLPLTPSPSATDAAPTPNSAQFSSDEAVTAPAIFSPSAFLSPPATTDMSPLSTTDTKPSPLLNGLNQFVCLWALSNGHDCNAIFATGEELQKHVHEMHLKNLPKDIKGGGFRCCWSGCTRKDAFVQRSKLGRHVQTHTGFKSEKCHVCGLQLSAKQSLRQHLLTHTNEKPWICDFEGCNRSFRQQSALTMHKRTHTGEKPLQCDICLKRFSESSNLSKHRKIHRDFLPLKCSFEGCSKGFRRPDQLRRHMDSHMRKQAKQQAAAAVAAGASSSTTPPKGSQLPLPEQQDHAVFSPDDDVQMDVEIHAEVDDVDTTASSETEMCDGSGGECCFEDHCEDANCDDDHH